MPELTIFALLLLKTILFSVLPSVLIPYKELPERIENTLARAVNSFHPRIAYGNSAPIEEFPYFASLVGCGAAILSDRWVVTAAHCLDPVTNYSLWVGGNSIDDSQEVYFDKVVLHPMFAMKNSVILHDIALVKLTKPLTFSAKVHPINLPEKPDSFSDRFSEWYFSDSQESSNDDSCDDFSCFTDEESISDSDYEHRSHNSGEYYASDYVLVGRGIDEKLKYSRILKQMNLNRLPLEICFDLLYPDRYEKIKNIMPLLNEIFFCGVRVENLLGAGVGDSGSPVSKDGKLVGITSFGIMAPGKWNDRVSFYVNVASYLSWIKSVTEMKTEG